MKTLQIVVFAILCISVLGNVEIRLTGSDSTKITLTIENKGNDVSFKKFNTPFFGDIYSDQFCIYDHLGKRVEYIAMLGKLVETPSILRSKEILEKVIDLSSLYKFTRVGEHLVSFCADLGDEVEVDHHPITVKVVPTDILSSRRFYTRYSSPRVSKSHKIEATSGCSASQISTLGTVHTSALTGCTSASSWVKNSGCLSRYNTWFGTYTNANGNQVKGHYDAAETAFEGTYTVRCDNPTSNCNQVGCGIYAFVYPSDTSHTINVCCAFWDAPTNTQQDSKPGTLIHEMLHFSDVAATNAATPETYGASACQALATSDPASARVNSDSHEYFVEFGTVDGDCATSSGSVSSSGSGSSSGGGSGTSTSGSSSSSESINLSSLIDALSNLTCFVATAAYGTPMNNELNTLREFRDEKMMDSYIGVRLIQFYYSVSPMLASIIAQHESLRFITRMLLWPIIKAIKYPTLSLFTVLIGALVPALI